MAESELVIQSWANRLRYFRYFRGYGGHVHDAETLHAAFAVSTVAQMRQAFDMMGIAIIEYSKEPKRMIPGRSYSAEEANEYPSIIPGTRWIEQPRNTTISGQSVRIYADYDRIDLYLGKDYEIVENDVISAEIIEKVLDLLRLPAIDPPFESYLFVMPESCPHPPKAQIPESH